VSDNELIAKITGVLGVQAETLRQVLNGNKGNIVEGEIVTGIPTWDQKYPQISKSWRSHWDNLITIFDYPPQIRKAVYTTNAIESLNSVIRKATKKRKLFPTDDAALKVVYLAVNQASKKWTMPIQNWKLALNRFSIEFGDRITDHL
jgi:putative transposase